MGHNLEPWKPSKDAPWIILIILIGLFCLNGCVNKNCLIKEKELEVDYNAKIGKLLYEIDVLKSNVKELEWRMDLNNNYDEERFQRIEEELKEFKKKWLKLK